MVREEQLPTISDINEIMSPIDFTDTFATTNHQDSLKEIAFAVFAYSPKWIMNLFKLRNFLVQFVGLKTDPPPQDQSEDFKVGGHVSFFEIYEIREDRLVMGAVDSHLSFKAVLINDGSEEYNIKFVTLVQYNNKLGRYYMAVVKPFHRIVVKAMFKQAYKG